MRIIKFPKRIRVTKRNSSLNIKVRCEKCGTVLLINRIDDVIVDNCVSFEYWSSSIPCFTMTCPYCDTSSHLSYNACKKIKKWVDVNSIDIKELNQNSFELFMSESENY